MTDLDLDAFMANHGPVGIWCLGCAPRQVTWPCLPYELAKRARDAERALDYSNKAREIMRAEKEHGWREAENWEDKAERAEQRARDAEAKVTAVETLGQAWVRNGTMRSGGARYTGLASAGRTLLEELGLQAPPLSNDEKAEIRAALRTALGGDHEQPGVPLSEVDPRLLTILRLAGDEWGPLGVAQAAQQFVTGETAPSDRRVAPNLGGHQPKCHICGGDECDPLDPDEPCPSLDHEQPTPEFDRTDYSYLYSDD